MAFKNEYLTEEEKQWFQEQQIPNPANDYVTLHPSRWTVDRERNMYFFTCYVYREPETGRCYYFYWKGFIFTFDFYNWYTEKSPETGKPEFLAWKKLNTQLIHGNGRYDAKELNQDLKEALDVHGDTGDPKKEALNDIPNKFLF